MTQPAPAEHCVRCGKAVTRGGMFCDKCRARFLAEIWDRIHNPPPVVAEVLVKRRLIIPAPLGDPRLN